MRIKHYANYSKQKTNGIDVVVYNLSKYQNIEHLGVKFKSEIFSFLDHDSFFQFLKEMRSDRPDFAILHAIYNPKTWCIYLMIRFYGIQYSVFPHSSLTTISQKKSKFKKILARKLFVNRIVNNAAYISFLNEEEKNNSITLNSKIEIVGNGVDIPEGTSNLSKELYFAFLGRYDINHKGIDILLESVFLVAEEFRKYEYKLIMHGFAEKENDLIFINDFISCKQIGDIVIVKSSITNLIDKNEFLAKANAFVLTSRYEGQPIACLESLAASTPLIVTSGTNMKDTVQKYDVGVCCDNVKDISEALVSVMKSSLFTNAHFYRASRTAKKYFSWERIAEKHLSNYLNYYD